MPDKEIILGLDVTVRELILHLQRLDQDAVVRLESTIGFPLHKIKVYSGLLYLSGGIR